MGGMDGLRKSLHLGHECNLTKQANSNIQDILALYPGENLVNRVYIYFNNF